ncbi:MAG: hypothetical protein J6K58_06650 [Lachnospiraceae bacterium]|nr:hypothetical protein [Lachnospiraceae bacterium]MBP3458871.1 hypothetical protein [Lachnospiraceae bacterium]
MKKIVECWKEKSIWEKIFPFALLLVYSLYHKYYDLSFGDTPDFFATVLKRGINSEIFPEDANVFIAICNFTKYRYYHWSSRTVIELLLIIVSAMPQIVWHILDLLSVLLIGYSLSVLVDIKDELVKYLCIFTMILMYPVIQMSSAGWIATTLNYSWVLAAGLYTLSIIKRIHCGVQISKVSYALGIVASIYAMNHEQMDVFMFLTIGVILIMEVAEKCLKKSLIPFMVINGVEIIYIATCPGNAERKIVETEAYFTDYLNYNFLDKINLGFSTTMNSFFESIDLMALVFFLLLAYLTLKSNEKAVYKVLSIVPISYYVIRFAFPNTRLLSSLKLSGLFSSCMEGKVSDITEESWKALIMMTVIVISVVVSYFVLLKKSNNRLILLIAFLAAVATRIILGFSASVFMSDERTLIYLCFGFIFSSLHLVGLYEEELDILRKRGFQIFSCIFDIALIASNLKMLSV